MPDKAPRRLSPIEIEALLGVRESRDHPLEILGYGYSTEGARRFREERPQVFPQIEAYLRTVLDREGIFPTSIDLADPSLTTFIRRDREFYRVSSVEESGVCHYARRETAPMPQPDAIRWYVRRVANPDYVQVPD